MKFLTYAGRLLITMTIAPLMIAGICAGLSMAAYAQSFPTKPIRWIVPFVPGGPADNSARVIAPRFGERIGQSVILETRAGASGNIGADAVLKSTPDGYTILYAISGMATNPAFVKGSPDPREFTSISMFMSNGFLMVGSNAFGQSSLPEVVAAMRAKPGAVSCASSGALPTVGCELLRAFAKVDLIMVSYKGNAPAMAALMGGEVNLLFDPITTALPPVKGGKVRAVASMNPKRGGFGLPELATAAEVFPDMWFEGWHGALGPGGMPREIVQRMNRDFDVVIKSAEVQKVFVPQGFNIIGGAPEVFTERIRNDLQKFSKVLADAGVKPE
ncbi:MAG: tripartite tricarboxylate transporter substrate binding protein [Betaproteobacteria bacterium]|nr:tripartite tricarboxylate transporter substrate binding protein [Betaproteobacteria bacterium]